MRTKLAALALALTIALSTAAFAGPRAPKTQDPQQDISPIEWVIRTVRKIVHTFDQPSVPIPGNPSTTT